VVCEVGNLNGLGVVLVDVSEHRSESVVIGHVGVLVPRMGQACKKHQDRIGDRRTLLTAGVTRSLEYPEGAVKLSGDLFLMNDRIHPRCGTIYAGKNAGDTVAFECDPVHPPRIEADCVVVMREAGMYEYPLPGPDFVCLILELEIA